MHANNTVVVLDGPIVLSATVGDVTSNGVYAYFPI